MQGVSALQIKDPRNDIFLNYRLFVGLLAVVIEIDKKRKERPSSLKFCKVF